MSKVLKSVLCLFLLVQVAVVQCELKQVGVDVHIDSKEDKKVAVKAAVEEHIDAQGEEDEQGESAEEGEEGEEAEGGEEGEEGEEVEGGEEGEEGEEEEEGVAEEEVAETPASFLQDYDEDKDGKISMLEFAGAMTDIEQKDMTEIEKKEDAAVFTNLKGLFAKADADADGHVSAAEVPNLMKLFQASEASEEEKGEEGEEGAEEEEKAETPETFLQDYDEDKDGNISMLEFTGGDLEQKDMTEIEKKEDAATLTNLKGLFTKADADKDGHVSAAEVASLMKLQQASEASEEHDEA